MRQKPGLKDSKKVVGLNLVSSKILDGNGFKAMPGSTPTPNSSSFENKKNAGNMANQKKKMFKKSLTDLR